MMSKEKQSIFIGKLATLRELWRHLSSFRKKQFFLATLFMVLGGFAEAISLGLVVPFLATMASPEKVLDLPGFQNFLDKTQSLIFACFPDFPWRFPEKSVALILLAALFAFSAILAGGLRLMVVWINVRLANAIGTDLGLIVYRRTLYQPYSVHISRNSSELISSLTSKVSLVTMTLTLWLTILTSAFMILFLVGTLFWITPLVTATVGTSLGFCYVLMTIVSNHKLVQSSKIISREQNQIVKALQEGLGGIRDILLAGTQPVYFEIFREADAALRRSYGNVAVIGQSPRFVMESVGMIVFAGLALVLAISPQGLIQAIPLLGGLALGVQRLLPALQQGYAAWSTIVSYDASNKEVVELLNQPLPPWVDEPQPDPKPLKKEIRFKSVSFRYSASGPLVLKNLSFNIPKGTRAGFVGKTGSGKSTCLDLLMGLLEPTTGQILIDGLPLSPRNLRAWQRNIAHVPQSIYLADTTLAENIAFGVAPEKIDMKRVREAARKAHISDFIESSPLGYQVLVGERGIRLSGGQRQRIGIARALYKQAQVLVFDEATSALDHQTEQAVIEAIEGLSSDLTILIIAHRLTTLKNCTQIIKLG
jgi:ABC-type multidrug transport system fused ATPase/permease subunit